MLQLENKIFLSWDDVNSLVNKLCERIEEEFFDSIKINNGNHPV